jgi:hypothetical protein
MFHTFALLMPFTFSRHVIIFRTDVMSHGTGRISDRRRKNTSNWFRIFAHMVALVSREIEFMYVARLSSNS